MSPERIERALSEVTREARTEALPAVEFDAIEAELPMTRVQTIPPRPFNWRPLLVAAAFAVGLGGVGYRLLAPSPQAPVASGAARRPIATATSAPGKREIDGDRLLPGARVQAGDVERAVVHAGHARWTLAAHSEGTLLTTGEIVTVRLDRGSVVSRVTKSSRTETFVIEAADVRVAAHGTEFLVALGADGVSVSVTEGTVLVGPREEPGTGQLLISPSSKRYTLAGLPLEPEATLGGLDSLRPGGSTRRAGTAAAALGSPDKSTSHEPALALAAPAPAKKSSTKPAAPASVEPPPVAEDLVPDQPSADGLDAATRMVMTLTQSCFKARTIAGEGVRVTAQTSITFRTLPKGGVNKVVFEPPLSPAVQACVNAGMSAIQTEATKHGFQVSKSIDLER